MRDRVKDFLSYRPLKTVWADPPMGMRVTVELIVGEGISVLINTLLDSICLSVL
jgi:hypothetical protein